MKKYLLVLSLFCSGCAVTYQLPVTQPKKITENLNKSNTEIFSKAKQVLVMEGFQISYSDETSGTLTTLSKRMQLTSEQCDCGTTMGLPYIKDNRTYTDVAFGIIVKNSTITISSTITGEYLKGDAMQGVNMKCVSKGLLEKDLLQKIKSE